MLGLNLALYRPRSFFGPSKPKLMPKSLTSFKLGVRRIRSTTALNRANMWSRGYSIKPLTVESHFPKLDKTTPPPTDIRLKKSERVRFSSYYALFQHQSLTVVSISLLKPV